MFSFNSIPFGWIGLAIAVMDFTGASKKLETALARYIEVEKQDAIDARKNLFTKDFGFHWNAFVNFLPSAAMMVALISGVWFWFGENNKMLWIMNWLPEWPWWSVVYWGPPALGLWYVFDHFTGEGFRFAISVVIWRFFWLLSLPKAGIIGTVGLLISVADTLIS